MLGAVQWVQNVAPLVGAPSIRAGEEVDYNPNPNVNLTKMAHIKGGSPSSGRGGEQAETLHLLQR